ncbi:BTB/POZ domain-containing protein [Ditylenchus destructor]|uniref:BTB/POZ domain-containing protein n=1 Tax=Ditylenchus destructor TaxID=166010 RepID=A0AAD4R234_9BILA|nr:BTB/POZ domain-containing protein [Ditylenchus destructor]
MMPGSSSRNVNVTLRSESMAGTHTPLAIGVGSSSSNAAIANNFQRLQRSSSSKRLEVVSKQATKVTAISTKLEWRIDQFEKLMKLFKNGHNLISKQFSCPQAPSVVWELHVYPNGKREEDNNNVSFFLRQVGLQRGEDPIMTEFQIYTLDGSSCRISVCRDTKDFSNQQGRGKFQVARDKMLAALHTDGSLLLVCEVEYLPPGSKISVEQEEDCEADDDAASRIEFSLRDANREMWENELFADCAIQVGTKTFMAHRCILGQNSLVFRSMFAQTTMLEAQNGKIVITDSRPEPVRAMLEFIYTGSISSGMMEHFAQGILAVADKYAVIPLKEYAEFYLASTITSKNVAQLAVVADTYFASHLKKACTRHIAAHHKLIIRSPEWRELKSARSELANELLESVLDDHAGSGDFGGESEDSILDESGTSSNGSAMADVLSMPSKKKRRM